MAAGEFVSVSSQKDSKKSLLKRTQIHIKNELFPGRLDVSKLKDVRRWRDFDEWFSAPMCGYQDAADFYRNSSPKYFIEGITIPTLLASAIIITDRHYVGHEDDTGYHHYAIDVAKHYVWEG